MKVFVYDVTLNFKAQEEMAWQIAKMIVNDVVHQSNHDSPGKSTKVQNSLSGHFPPRGCVERLLL